MLLLLALAGCGRAGEPTVAGRWAPAEQLAGRWRWVSSLDVRTQAERSPATEGFTAELHFTATSPSEGTFVYRREGAAPVHGTFAVTSEDAPGNDFIVIEPGIDFLQRHAWLTVTDDLLRLGGAFELGHNSVYARLAP